MDSTCAIKGDLPGTPKDMGPPHGKGDPYYSHILPNIFRDSYGSGIRAGNSTVWGPPKGSYVLGDP